MKTLSSKTCSRAFTPHALLIVIRNSVAACLDKTWLPIVWKRMSYVSYLSMDIWYLSMDQTAMILRSGWSSTPYHAPKATKDTARMPVKTWIKKRTIRLGQIDKLQKVIWNMHKQHLFTLPSTTSILIHTTSYRFSHHCSSGLPRWRGLRWCSVPWSPRGEHRSSLSKIQWKPMEKRWKKG